MPAPDAVADAQPVAVIPAGDALIVTPPAETPGADAADDLPVSPADPADPQAER
jgi:hypothetical protein